MLSEQEIDAAHLKFAWVNLNCTEHRDAFARAIESAATASLLARIAALEAANEAFGKRQEWWHTRMLELEQQLAEARKDAIPAMRAYAAKNPRYVSHEDVVQDPNGVHAWLEKHGAAIKEQT